MLDWSNDLAMLVHLKLSGQVTAQRLDVRDTAGHLGEWTDTSRITFGRDGVPFYLSGPYDNPRSVVRTLDRTCGQGNYHYLVGQG